MSVSTAPVRLPAADYLVDVCRSLRIAIQVEYAEHDVIRASGPSGEHLVLSLAQGSFGLVEQVLRQLRFRFSELPMLVRGSSKEVRLLTDQIALAKLLPSVYSFTNNRSGTAPGTDTVRAHFSASIFRSMANDPGSRHIATAFLGLINTQEGPLLAEEVVDDCNLEVRVKRFHIGSPVHRYRYTTRHATVAGPPLARWTRFDPPVVCFDWRHPLTSENGDRLADEPLSDDYAGVWMHNIPEAKRLALDAFAWLEERFGRAQLRLVDICFFIDRSGRVLYGEISPDCMRVRSEAADDADALDKDTWRGGGTPDMLLSRYRRLHQLVSETLIQEEG